MSVALLDACLTGDQEVAGRQHWFMETDHKTFSIIILFLPLIQEGQLPVSGERYTIVVNCLED